MLGIFLDTETNGLDFKAHRILEIAFKIIDLKRGNEVASYQSVLFQPIEVWEKSDKISLKVNGIEWETVQQGIPESNASADIIQIFNSHQIRRGRAVFICQNPSFDRSFFTQLVHPDIQEKYEWPYHWLDLASMHWSLAIYHHREKKCPLPWEIGLSKDRIASFYKIKPEARPHRAMNGVDHLIACYEKIVGFQLS